MIPEVSIVVPVYNASHDLRRCLDSLVAQTMAAIEVICVDDGSTDDGVRILAEYAARDGRFRVFRQENAGQSVARNVGIGVASAEFVMFCDADDWAEPTWCERLYAEIAGRADVDLVVARASIDGTCSARQRVRLERNQRLRFSGVRSASAAMFPHVDHSLWTKIFRKSLLSRHELRFPVGEYCEDWTFSYAYLSVCRNVAFLDCRLYHYFQREGSTLNGGGGADRVILDFVRQWGRLRSFLMAVGKWSEWRLPMLAFGVRLFGIGGDTMRPRVLALADELLDGLPEGDFKDLPPSLAADVSAVRDHTIGARLCRKWRLGPLTVAKRIRDTAGDRLYVLGVLVREDWF